MSADQAILDLTSHGGRRADPPRMLGELVAKTGVQINGDRPWDIQVFDPAVYRRLLTHGSLAFGETYTDGLWECERLDELMHRLLLGRLDEHFNARNRLRLAWNLMRHVLCNPQSRSRAFQVGKRHYDIGNDVFEAMLDPTMSYSCGYWERAGNLAEAQEHKLHMICRKLQLEPGEKLLDIGCGWGGLARVAAENYGVEVTGITVSREQEELAQRRCAGLPVTIALADYRSLKGRFDKVVSVGMFEHVGIKNYRDYFNTVDRVMSPDGIFLLHTIGDHTSRRTTDPWIDNYIFPNGKLPSARHVADAVENRFLIEDWHNFGHDYDRTLIAWWERFDRAWAELKRHYDTRFYRMWRYYLLTCAGFFRSRQGQLWQIVLTKQERGATYRSVR
jgi:cyclopropane-fatty-acyl-phospholipid synthase